MARFGTYREWPGAVRLDGGWTMLKVRDYRKKGGELIPLGTFVRPCATPGCRCRVRTEVSLNAIDRGLALAELGSPFLFGELGRTRCPRCVKAWKARTPETIAAARRETTRLRVARWRASKKLAATAAGMV